MRLTIWMLAVVACGQGHRAPAPAPAPDDATSRPAFASFVDIVKAGKDARKKFGVVSVRRVAIQGNDVYAIPCDWPAGHVGFTFKRAQRDLVRGLPAMDDEPCGQVVLRIGEASTYMVIGDAIGFPGVTPRPAPTPPPGADFGDVDEIAFTDVDALDGKLAELSGTIAEDADGLWFSPCGRPTVRARLEAKPGTIEPTTECTTIRVRVTRDARVRYTVPDLPYTLKVVTGR